MPSLDVFTAVHPIDQGGGPRALWLSWAGLSITAPVAAAWPWITSPPTTWPVAALTSVALLLTFLAGRAGLGSRLRSRGYRVGSPEAPRLLRHHWADHVLRLALAAACLTAGVALTESSPQGAVAVVTTTALYTPIWLHRAAEQGPDFLSTPSLIALLMVLVYAAGAVPPASAVAVMCVLLLALGRVTARTA